MRKLYNDRPALFSPAPWEVSETDFSEADNKFRESVFAVANGYIGVRGFFEEGFCGAPENSDPVTMLNGVYEYHDYHYMWRRPGFPARTQVITRQANPLEVFVEIGGERVHMTHEGYRRTLDLRTGVLTRTFIFTAKDGNKISLTYERFACQHDKHLLCCRIRIRAEKAAECKVIGVLRPADGGERLPDGEDAIYLPLFLKRDGDVCTVGYKTRRSGFTVVCAVCEAMPCAGVHTVSDGAAELASEFSVSLAAGQEAVYERTGAFACRKDTADAAAFAVQKARDGARCGFDSLLGQSRSVLDEFWDYSDVCIDGDPLVQQGIRFSLFQVFQSAGRDGYTNISANGLSGTVYSGQTFWDTEMYMMPMFTYGLQEISRQLLLYRYHILDKSRQRAKEMDDAGALYSWNTINGEECGYIFEAATAQYHINADISFAMENYFDASQDEEFIVDYGAEMLFEMSKCLSHRGSFSKERGGKFCINVICGPDEYNPVVDNNMYTNYMTKRMFEFTLRVRAMLERKYPQKLKELERKCGMDGAEFDRIALAAEKMYFPYNEEYGMYMQDDNFMYKDALDIDAIPAEKLPLLFSLHPLNLWRYQVCKQADLVLLTFLCSEFFSKEQIRRIFEYYEPKTLHDSSLSAAVHSIVACALGNKEQAYSYLKQASRLDLDDVNGNTSVGLHAACMGGAWMLLVNGYAGLRIYGEALHFAPLLHDTWKGYTFKIHYRGCLLLVRVEKENTYYRLLRGKKLRIFHNGSALEITDRETIAANAA